MKYANLIAATHFSSVGTAAFFGGQRVRKRPVRGPSLPLSDAARSSAPPFFSYFIYERRRFHETFNGAGSRVLIAISYPSTSFCQLRSPTKLFFVLLFFPPLSAPTQLLEPPTLPGIVSCMLCVLCGGLNLLRGVHAIESILQVGPPEEKKN